MESIDSRLIARLLLFSPRMASTQSLLSEWVLNPDWGWQLRYSPHVLLFRTVIRVYRPPDVVSKWLQSAMLLAAKFSPPFQLTITRSKKMLRTWGHSLREIWPILLFAINALAQKFQASSYRYHVCQRCAIQRKRWSSFREPGLCAVQIAFCLEDQAHNLPIFIFATFSDPMWCLLIRDASLPTTPTLPEQIIRMSHAAQLSCVGRGGNSWESPPGCLMVSFTLQESDGRTLPFLQYVVCLAIVQAVEHLSQQRDAVSPPSTTTSARRPLSPPWSNTFIQKGLVWWHQGLLHGRSCLMAIIGCADLAVEHQVAKRSVC